MKKQQTHKEEATKVDAPVAAKIAEASEETSSADVGTSGVEYKEIQETVVEGRKTGKQKISFEKEQWQPKTSLGQRVKSGEVTSIDSILDKRERILEPEIVDSLIPHLVVDLLMLGQSKGKFGGGQKRVFKQTQKKTQEGNKPKFSTCAVVGNEDGYIGMGYGKSKETVPAREKAIRQAKLNFIKIRRGCGDWRCGCGDPHTIPFKVMGKCGSVVVEIFPAPKGTGMKIEKECSKILKLAGISDIWSKTEGQTKSKTNLFSACFNALKNLMEIKLQEHHYNNLNIIEGSIANKKSNTNQN